LIAHLEEEEEEEKEEEEESSFDPIYLQELINRPPVWVVYEVFAKQKKKKSSTI